MDPKDKLLKKVLNYLSYRDRTQHELVTYLEKKNATPEQVAQLMQRISESGFVDDAKFAKSLIRAKVSRGDGRKKIYFNLLNKGIERSLAKQSLDDTDLDLFITNATQFTQKKLKNFKETNPYKIKQRIYQILSQRGHSYDVIKAVIDALLLER